MERSLWAAPASIWGVVSILGSIAAVTAVCGTIIIVHSMVAILGSIAAVTPCGL